MRKLFKTILVLTLVFSFATQAHIAIKDTEFNEMTFDFENTYANFTKSPDCVLDGELLIIGDSFAFLLAQSSGYETNYIVHQGYCLQSIYENLIDEIPPLLYKYAFLFIGPNDFMNQTDVNFFQNTLIDIINKLKNKGIKVVLTNYLSPDFNSENCKHAVQDIPISLYDILINNIASMTDSIYFDINDLYSQYGRIEGDGIHPNRKIYKPIMDRLIGILKDKM